MNEHNDYIDRIFTGDSREVLQTLPDGIADCCITSPPYYALRDYGNERQIGHEETPEEFIAELVKVFHEIKRVLKEDGVLWVNMGDSYVNTNGFARASQEFQRKGRNDAPANDRSLNALHSAGYKTKDLIGIPWMLAFALRADGWFLRQDIIWAKPNPMPESVQDRCTRSHEYIFLLSKSQKYFFDSDAIKEPSTTKDNIIRNRETTKGNNVPGKAKFHGLTHNDYDMRNKRDVWTITTKPLAEEHFAAYPEELVETCLKAGCPVGGVVIDPFFGSGTTGRVAQKLNRHYIGIELNSQYVEICERRNSNIQMSLFGLI